MIFGFIGWGEEIHDGDMGEFCNCGGDSGGGICCCFDKVSETKGVSVIVLIKVD